MSQPLATSGRFFGKFRGIVADNKDTQSLGRIRATLPSFQGLLTNWAMPCVPYAGTNVGFFCLPPIGASVWIEFEGGNPSYPVWTGCFWERNDLPSDLLGLNTDDVSQVKFWKTTNLTMILNDSQSQGDGSGGGGFTLQISSPAVQTPITITGNTQGVTITTGVSTALLDPQNGITLTVDQTKITMTQQAITATSTSISDTASQDLTLKGGTVSVTSDGGATVSANGGSLALSGSTAATMNGGTSAKVSAGGDISIDGGATGAVSIKGSAVSVNPIGDVTVSTGGAVNLTAGAEAGMTAGGELSLKAGAAAQLNAGADVTVGAGLGMQLTASLDIMYSGVTHVVNGVMEVNGALLEDSMPVLVAPF